MHDDLHDVSLTTEQNAASGEFSVNRYTFRGTHSGRRVEITGIDMVRVLGGKLAEHWALLDSAALRHQISTGPDDPVSRRDKVPDVNHGPVPPQIDTSKPHAARMYDYFLGGKDNFSADRDTADQALQAWPAMRTAARQNRAFLGRAARYLAGEAGVTQFLDVGSGLPGVGNVHEVAQAANPAARVVYVDNDPIVLAHGRALLGSTPQGRSVYIEADLREPGTILSHPMTRETLDFAQPVALMLVSVLHFFTDDAQVRQIVRDLVGALPPGSYVAASHATSEFAPATVDAGRAYTRRGVDVVGRDAGVFADLVFGGLTLVPPGVVVVSEWRPEPGVIQPPRADVSNNGAIARKP